MTVIHCLMTCVGHEFFILNQAIFAIISTMRSSPVPFSAPLPPSRGVFPLLEEMLPRTGNLANVNFTLASLPQSGLVSSEWRWGAGGAGRDEETQSTYRGEAKVLCTHRAHPSEL